VAGAATLATTLSVAATLDVAGATTLASTLSVGDTLDVTAERDMDGSESFPYSCIPPPPRTRRRGAGAAATLPDRNCAPRSTLASCTSRRDPC